MIGAGTTVLNVHAHPLGPGVEVGVAVGVGVGVGDGVGIANPPWQWYATVSTPM